MQASQDDRRAGLFLPNEVLRKIFVYLGSGSVRTDSGRRRQLRPIYSSLRSACHRTRTLVNAMPFWYTEDVDIADLLPPTRYAHGLNEGVGIITMLKVMLEDQGILDSLAKREKWRFKEASSFFIIRSAVPAFHDTAKCVVLDFSEELCWYRRCSPNALIRNFGVCPNLTTLEFSPLQKRVSLDLIQAAAPNLEELLGVDIGSQWQWPAWALPNWLWNI